MVKATLSADIYTMQGKMDIFSNLHSYTLWEILVLICFLSCNHEIFANELGSKSLASQAEYKQWFTGPILTPNPTTVPPGHPGLELVVIASRTYGYYDSKWKLKNIADIWGIRPVFDFQAGFNSVLGIELIGSAITNFSQGESYTYLQDSIFRLGFQISTDKKDSWVPDFRILLQETLPTGNYQKLERKKKGTDLTGQGSFQTGVQLVFQKLFFEESKHAFRLRGSIGYFIPAPVCVKGLSYYGGDSKTEAIVYPGKYFTGFLFGEYALSRRWALACELNYQQGEKGRFTRKKGGRIKVPSFSQLSIFPEIQHTYTANLGIVIGSGFTIAGKNSVAFSEVFFAALFLF